MLNNLINRTIKPFLIVAGIATCGLISLLIVPQTMLFTLFHLSYQPEYTIIVQHWAVMITLVGILMILAAFISRMRIPVLFFALLEKLALIGLGLIYIHDPATAGFLPAIVMDSLISLYLLLYFINLALYRVKG